jgi:hypothetical protein
MKVPLGDEQPLAGVPNLALRRERAANLHGALLLGARTLRGTRVAAARAATVVVVLDVTWTTRKRMPWRGCRHVVCTSRRSLPARRGAPRRAAVTTVAEEQGRLRQP